MSPTRTTLPHLATCALITAISLAFTPAEAATLINGSFENTASTYSNTPDTDQMSDVAAPGWFVSTNSPDWFLGAPGPSGRWLTPWGDFFAMGASEGTSYREGISQTISDLVIGQSYAINFQQANGLLYDQGSYLGAGRIGGWEVLVDGISIGTSASTNDNSTPAPSFPGSWNAGLATFEATATTQTIEFLAYGGADADPTFQFLDNVTINPIPEPSTPLLAILVALSVTLRRRKDS